MAQHKHRYGPGVLLTLALLALTALGCTNGRKAVVMEEPVFSHVRSGDPAFMQSRDPAASMTLEPPVASSRNWTAAPPARAAGKPRS